VIGRPHAPAWTPVAPALAGAAVAAWLLVRGGLPSLALASGCCIAVCALLVGWERMRSGDWMNGASFLLIPVALGFGLRGLSLLGGDSTLSYPSWVAVDVRDRLAETAVWTATLGAATTYLGYLAGVRLAGHRPLGRARDVDPRRARLVVGGLVAIGLAGFAILVQQLGGVAYFRNIAYARLDTTGLGLFKLAATGLRFALLVWIATTPKLSRRRLVVACLAVLLLTTGQRSAVFATLIPVLLVYHYRVRRLPVRAFAIAAALSIVVAVGIVQYRQYTRTAAAGPNTVAGIRVTHHTPPQPSTSVFRSALVSLDGLVLVQQAVPSDIPPNFGDKLLLVPEGWVPHALWSGKHQWQSNVLANRYLGFAHGGVFLSGFGTMWAAGLLPGVVLGSLLLGFGVGWVYGRMRRFGSAAWVLVYAVVANGAARFMLAGDEVSIFFFTQALVAVLITIRLVTVPAHARA
jgi:hypothetical protein